MALFSLNKNYLQTKCALSAADNLHPASQSGKNQENCTAVTKDLRTFQSKIVVFHCTHIVYSMQRTPSSSDLAVINACNVVVGLLLIILQRVQKTAVFIA